MYSLEEIKKNIAENVTGKIVAMHTADKHVYGFKASKHVVDSVTQKNILEKPHLIPWAIGLAIDFLEEDKRFEQLQGPTRDDLIMTAKFMHRDNRDEAGTIGGKAHEVIEEWINIWIDTGVRPPKIENLLQQRGVEDHRVWGACRSAEAVFDKYQCVPVAAEILVGIDGEKKPEGAGTLDLLVWVPDGNGIRLPDGVEVGHLELWDWKSSNNVNDFYAMQVATYRRYFMRMTGLKIKKVLILKLDKTSDRFKSYLVPRPNEAAAAFRGLSRVYDWIENNKKKLSEDKVRIII